MDTIKRLLQLRLYPKEIARTKRVLASIMLPITLFYMTSANILLASALEEVTSDQTLPVAAEEAEPEPEEKDSVLEKKEELPEPKSESSAPKEEITTPIKEDPVDSKLNEPVAPKDEPEEKDPAPAETTSGEILGDIVAPFDVAPITDPNDIETLTPGTVDNNNPSANLNVSSPVAIEDVSVPIEKIETWKENDDGSYTTNEAVVLDKEYSYPKDEKVIIKFTELPENSGKITIKEIELSKKEKAEMGIVSDRAYDITSDMENGSFKFELSLPLPENLDLSADRVEIKYAENVSDLVKADPVEKDEKVDEKLDKNEDTLTVKDVDHFTIFAIFASASNIPDADTSENLAAVGPINAVTGLPDWYQDSNGNKLTYCNDIADPNCGGPAANEFFYWSAESSMTHGGGDALLVMALEVIDGNTVFTRVRVRIDAAVAGTYTVVHPFGNKSYTVTADQLGARAIDDTIDIPGVNAVLSGNIGPFLTAVSPAPPAGYIGNPNIEQTVTGSPTGKNYFEIQGPAGSNLGGGGADTIRNDSFIVLGKLFVDPTLPPIVTVNTLATADTTPDITGTVSVSDPQSTVSVIVNGETVNATVDALGNWTATLLTPLANGIYDVTAVATNANGSGTDTTLNELIVNAAFPTVIVNSQTTADTTPTITGGVSDPAATVAVTVGAQTVNATVNLDGTWSATLISAVTGGVHDVIATATNGAGSVTDTTVGELIVNPPNKAGLAAVSPLVDSVNGFPVWYQDQNGLKLQLNTDPNDPLSLADPTIAGNARSLQTGFGAEAFYWSGESIITFPDGGQALLVMALEAAYGSADGNPQSGQEMVFARVRVRIDAPQAGNYTVTHPFGSKTYTVTTPGTRAINDTIDIGTVPLAFNGALSGGIGPFLTAVSPVAPAGYVGSPLVEQTVTGSPTGNNFFRVEGPNGTFTHDHFTLSGKIFVDTVTAPLSVSVNPQTATTATPTITGGVTDPTATVNILVAGQNISAVVDPTGAWTATVSLPITPDGTYDVTATATNATETDIPDLTSGELIINTAPDTTGLVAVGPTNATTGFPDWYQDANGVQLMFGDPNDPLTTADPVITGNTQSVQSGFGAENFYWTGESTLNFPGGGQATLVMALEAAYGTGDPAPNEQMVFTRIRVRIDAPATGNYTVTHPFGTETFTATTIGPNAINETIDLGAIPLNFNAALNGNIGPFLVAVNPAPPAGYIGDPNITQTVTGSPNNTNFFQVAGPSGTFTTDQFAIGGKIFGTNITGVVITPAAPTIFVGDTQQFLAEQLSNGTLVATSFTWANTNPAVGSIDPVSGLYTAISAGNDTVTATATDSTSSSVTVIVSEVPVVASINITSNITTVAIGSPAQFTAEALDAANNPINTVLRWSNLNAASGLINRDTGVYTAITHGIDTIIVTDGTIQSVVNITVTGQPALQANDIILTIPNVVVSIGATQQVAAVAQNSNGDPVAVPITFISSNTAVGTIDPNTGAFTAAGSGVTIITATANNATVTENIIVLTSAQTTPDANGIASLTQGVTEVVIADLVQPVTLTIDPNTVNPTINLSALVSSGSGSIPQITINSDKANVVIPATIVTSADPTWDGTIAAPTDATITLAKVSGKTRTVTKAIEIGFTGAALSFDNAVRLVFENQSDKRVGYSRIGADFTEITNVCSADSQAAGDALPAGGDCKITVGKDLVVWTKHFTTFVTYTETNDVSSTTKNSSGDDDDGDDDDNDDDDDDDGEDKVRTTVTGPVLYRGSSQGLTSGDDSGSQKDSSEDVEGNVSQPEELGMTDGQVAGEESLGGDETEKPSTSRRALPYVGLAIILGTGIWWWMKRK